MICSISRILLPAWVAGIVVADLTHSNPTGWIVAAAVGGLVYLARSRYPRLAGGTCPVPDTPARKPGPAETQTRDDHAPS